MQTSQNAIRSVLLAVAVPLLSCGPAPVPYAEGETETLGAPSTGTLPADHPPLDGGVAARPGGGAEVTFAGVVRLRGELAERTEGYVFVSVKPDGIGMPSYSRRYSFADPAFHEAADGERILEFQLDETFSLGGLGPGGHVVEAMFSPDGTVEASGVFRSEPVPIEPGESGVEVVLDPGGG